MEAKRLFVPETLDEAWDGVTGEIVAFPTAEGPSPVARVRELVAFASSVVPPLGLYAGAGVEIVEELFFRVLLFVAFLWASYGVAYLLAGP